MLKDFLLDSDVVLSEAVINNSVEVVVNSALIALKMIFFALADCSIVRIASFRDEALSLAPVVHSSNIATVALIVRFIAVDKFLRSKSDLLLACLAYAVFGNSE